MKKRAKIIAIVSTLCLCLSLFVVGVLAVSTASLSVTSSLSFKSNGAYVMVDGQLKQGATKESATLQSEAPATYTYKGYSYNCIGGTGADKDKPDGTASLENFVDASGEPNAPWAIGEINFTSELPVAVYHFTFTNYSAMMVAVSVSSNIQDLNADLAGKVSITESFESGSTIDAYDGTTAKTTVYTITVEITDYTTGFENKQLDLTIQFDTAELNREYFKYNTAGTQITGLSEKYFEDNPSVLIVPGKTESGESLTIASGQIETEPYIATFDNLASPIVVIQEGIINLSDAAFFNCKVLTNINLPNDIKSIGNVVFYGCINLSNIFLPNSINSVGTGAFANCTSLEYIKIPDNVKVIDGTFMQCTNLKIVELPNSVTTIGVYGFMGCSSLTSIILPNSLTQILDSAFLNCTSLEEIYIPDKVTDIGNGVFGGCINLSIVKISGGVVNLGMQIFAECNNLISIDMTNVVDWNNLTLGSSSFNTNALTSAPTVITISSNADIQTVISKLTSSVIGSSMTNKIELTNGSTTYVWNGTAWAEQTA